MRVSRFVIGWLALMPLFAWAEFTCSATIAEATSGVSVRAGTLTWRNTGSSGISAPYVRVQAKDGVLIRMSDADAWGKSIEVLALSEQSSTSSLRMGESVEIPVFIYTATQETQMTPSHAQSSMETSSI